MVATLEVTKTYTKLQASWSINCCSLQCFLFDGFCLISSLSYTKVVTGFSFNTENILGGKPQVNERTKDPKVLQEVLKEF